LIAAKRLSGSSLFWCKNCHRGRLRCVRRRSGCAHGKGQLSRSESNVRRINSQEGYRTSVKSASEILRLWTIFGSC